MTRDEHLLTCLAEECAEVAQRVAKALRFGLDEVQEGQALNNKERISEELFDLVAVAIICDRAGLVVGVEPNERKVQRKLEKIERYFEISRKQGKGSPARGVRRWSVRGSRLPEGRAVAMGDNPHPTGSDASVTEAMVEAARLAWMTCWEAGDRDNNTDPMRAALTAALSLPTPKGFVPLSVYESAVKGRQDFRRILKNSRGISEAQVVQILKNKYDASGLSYDKFGESVSLSGEFVRNVLNGSRPPSKAILELIGVERRITYSTKESVL